MCLISSNDALLIQFRCLFLKLNDITFKLSYWQESQHYFNANQCIFRYLPLFSNSERYSSCVQFDVIWMIKIFHNYIQKANYTKNSTEFSRIDINFEPIKHICC